MALTFWGQIIRIFEFVILYTYPYKSIFWYFEIEYKEILLEDKQNRSEIVVSKKLLSYSFDYIF